MFVCVFFFSDMYKYNVHSLNLVPPNPKMISVFTSRPSLGAHKPQASNAAATATWTLSPYYSLIPPPPAALQPGKKLVSRVGAMSLLQQLDQSSLSQFLVLRFLVQSALAWPWSCKVDLSFSPDVMCPFATMSTCVPPSLPRPKVLPSSSTSLLYAHTPLKPLENVWES